MRRRLRIKRLSPRSRKRGLLPTRKRSLRCRPRGDSDCPLDLDIRIVPASAKLTGRARVTVRNESDKPLDRIALQVSSSLKWESVSSQGRVLPVAQHLLDTDADHTGKASELIVVLPQPLAAGASITLDTFYSGTVEASGGRLERLGASDAQA